MNPEADVLDAIDALVDEQLEQEASGYDHNINQDTCPHCDGDWHGMPLTRRVQQLRQAFAMGYRVDRELADYRADEDESELLCPGSMFIGPRAPTQREKRKYAVTIVNPPTRGSVIDFQIMPDQVEQFREPWGWGARTTMVEVFRTIEVTFRNVSSQLHELLGTEAGEVGEVVEETPQQRALPRPASTPPMWANNPTRSRRRR